MLQLRDTPSALRASMSVTKKKTRADIIITYYTTLLIESFGCVDSLDLPIHKIILSIRNLQDRQRASSIYVQLMESVRNEFNDVGVGAHSNHTKNDEFRSINLPVTI